MKNPIVLTLVLAGMWLAWSGHTEPLILALGAGSLVFVVGLASRMKVVDSESVPLGLNYFRLLAYLPWLWIEILKSALDVSLRIVRPGPLRISPRLIRVTASQHSDLARVIYANSITLTPGTVSVDVVDGQVLVHALHAEAARGVETGVMDAKCTRVENAAT